MFSSHAVFHEKFLISICQFSENWIKMQFITDRQYSELNQNKYVHISTLYDSAVCHISFTVFESPINVQYVFRTTDDDQNRNSRIDCSKVDKTFLKLFSENISRKPFFLKSMVAFLNVF